MKKNKLTLLIHPYDDKHRQVRDFILDYPSGGSMARGVAIFTKEDLIEGNDNHKTPIVVTNLLEEIKKEKADGIYFVDKKSVENKGIVKFLRYASTKLYWKIKDLIDYDDYGISIHAFLKKNFEQAIKKRYYSFDDDRVKERRFLTAIMKRINKYDGIYFD